MKKPRILDQAISVFVVHFDLFGVFDIVLVF